MRLRCITPVVAAVIALASAEAASADDMSAKLCKALSDVAADTAQQADYAVQAAVIMSVAGAFEESPELLGKVMTEADALATKDCSDIRTTILERTNKQSLYDVMR